MKEEIQERVKQVIVDKLGVREEKVTPTAHMSSHLGADSLDMVEIVMEFEKMFGIQIPDEVAEKIETVDDIVNAIVEQKN